MNSSNSGETKDNIFQSYDEEKAYAKIQSILKGDSFYKLPNMDELKLINEYLKFVAYRLNLPSISKNLYSNHFKMMVTSYKCFMEEVDIALSESIRGKKEFTMDLIFKAVGWKKEMLVWGLSQIHTGITLNKSEQKKLKKEFASQADQVSQKLEEIVPGAKNFLNEVLGKKFKETIIDANKGDWFIYPEECGKYVAKLQGKNCYMNSSGDCAWFKAKLKKAGIAEEDIHFDSLQQTDKIIYQLRVTNIQKIVDPKEEHGCTCEVRHSTFTW